MKNFDKKITKVYIALFLVIIFGKIFLETNHRNFYDLVFIPISLIALTILCFKINENEKLIIKHQKNYREILIIIMMTYIIIYFCSGLIFSFTKSPYDHSLLGLLRNIWSYLFIIVLKEYIRFVLLKYSGRKKIFFLVVVLLFSIMELNISTLLNISSSIELFKYLGFIIFPIICHNVLASYLVLKSDYVLSIIYLITLKILVLFLPIYPNLNWFLSFSYEIVLAFLIFFFTSNYYERKVSRNNEKEIMSFKMILPTLILIVIFIVFISGYFKYNLIGIISNSMNPDIKRGDAIIMKKLENEEIKNLELYDIIGYKLENSIIVHRIVAIDLDDDGKYLFTTKGDYNKANDDEKVKEEQVVGKVIYKIPKIGYPKIWLYESFLKKTDLNIEMGN